MKVEKEKASHKHVTWRSVLDFFSVYFSLVWICQITNFLLISII